MRPAALPDLAFLRALRALRVLRIGYMQPAEAEDRYYQRLTTQPLCA